MGGKMRKVLEYSTAIFFIWLRLNLFNIGGSACGARFTSLERMDDDGTVAGLSVVYMEMRYVDV
jgi:hypothetical protein